MTTWALFIPQYHQSMSGPCGQVWRHWGLFACWTVGAECNVAGNWHGLLMLSHYTTKEESPLLYGDEFVCLLLSGHSQTRAVVSTFWADYFGSGRMQKKNADERWRERIYGNLFVWSQVRLIVHQTCWEILNLIENYSAPSVNNRVVCKGCCISIKSIFPGAINDIYHRCSNWQNS